MSGSAVQAYIAVGSNINPEENIVKGLQFLAKAVSVTSISTFYRTEAIGRPSHAPFLNGVCGVRTALAPRTLKFDVLRPIEDRLGRVRSEDKLADRTIDLDVILHGQAVIRDADLQVPAPEIRDRPFVAVALFELAPDTVLPDTGEPLAAVVEGQDAAELVVEPEFTRRLKAKLRL